MHASTLRTFPRPSYVLECVAKRTFFAQYIYISPAEPTKTDFEWILPMYASVSQDGLLSDIVSTLGMLALAQSHKDPSIRLASRQRYTRVLNRTMAALEDNKNVRSDETLATVSLLALHEVMTVLSTSTARGIR